MKGFLTHINIAVSKIVEMGFFFEFIVEISYKAHQWWHFQEKYTTT